MLLFFLPVLLQNECSYFFPCCILAFYIVFTYPSHTIIHLLACILFCFFELNMQLLACLIFCNRFVNCFIVFSLTIVHICICCFFASSCRCHFVIFGGCLCLLFAFFCVHTTLFALLHENLFALHVLLFCCCSFCLVSCLLFLLCKVAVDINLC